MRCRFIISLASMGPRHLSRGYTPPVSVTAVMPCPSMGPRLMSRGYVPGEAYEPEMVDDLQWGRG